MGWEETGVTSSVLTDSQDWLVAEWSPAHLIHNRCTFTTLELRAVWHLFVWNCLNYHDGVEIWSDFNSSCSRHFLTSDIHQRIWTFHVAKAITDIRGTGGGEQLSFQFKQKCWESDFFPAIWEHIYSKGATSAVMLSARQAGGSLTNWCCHITVTC